MRANNISNNSLTFHGNYGDTSLTDRLAADGIISIRKNDLGYNEGVFNAKKLGAHGFIPGGSLPDENNGFYFFVEGAANPNKYNKECSEIAERLSKLYPDMIIQHQADYSDSAECPSVPICDTCYKNGQVTDIAGKPCKSTVCVPNRWLEESGDQISVTVPLSESSSSVGFIRKEDIVTRNDHIAGSSYVCERDDSPSIMVVGDEGRQRMSMHDFMDVCKEGVTYDREKQWQAMHDSASDDFSK